MNESISIFNAYSSYYDLLYKDKNYASEANYIRKLLSRYGIFNGDLLEFGSGTGKHGRLLASHDFRVHGIERSYEMVEQTLLTENFSCQQGDICNIKLNRTYSAVISLFHVISYQITNENLNAVFNCASEHLTTGGLFIFDFWYSPAVFSQRPVTRIKRMADSKLEITRIGEPKLYSTQNRVDVNFQIFAKNLVTNEVQSFSEIHPMRHFSLPEIDLLCKYHGFERVCSEEFLTEKVPSEETWGVCVVLKRV